MSKKSRRKDNVGVARQKETLRLDKEHGASIALTVFGAAWVLFGFCALWYGLRINTTVQTPVTVGAFITALGAVILLRGIMLQVRHRKERKALDNMSVAPSPVAAKGREAKGSEVKGSEAKAGDNSASAAASSPAAGAVAGAAGQKKKSKKRN